MSLLYPLPITHNETAEDAVMEMEDDEKLFQRDSYIVLLRLECAGFDLHSCLILTHFPRKDLRAYDLISLTSDHSKVYSNRHWYCE